MAHTTMARRRAEATMDREEVIRVIRALREMRDKTRQEAGENRFMRGLAAGYDLALNILWREWDNARH